MATEVNLVLGADTTQVDKGTTSLDQITGAAKKTASELAALAKVEEALWEAGAKLVLSLQDQVATYGLTTLEVQALRAAQLGVVDQSIPYIAQLDAMAAATKRYGVTIHEVAEIESARIAWEESALTAFNAFKIRTLAENAAAEAAALATQEQAQTAFNAFKIRTMADNRAAAILDINEQAAAQDAALAKQEQALTAFNAFKIRTMADNRTAAIAILDEQEAVAAALAEKQAIAEIAWGDLSIKTRIAQLEKLKAYQANSAISSTTVTQTFSSAAINDLPNLTKYQTEYQAALQATASAHAAVKTSAEGASAAVKETGVQTARATSEVVVLGRELSRGNYSRMAGSFTILAQALGLTVNPLVVVAGAFAAITYEVVRGSLEQEKMNAALVTTGNYAGVTSSALNELAHVAASAGGSISSAKDAVTALAGSGKVTSDEIGKISEASVLMERATGQSVTTTIAQFESLAVQMQGSSVKSTEAVSKAALKLDDTYHFLSDTIFEQIRTLEKDGEAKKASQLAMETYAEVTKQRALEVIADAGSIATAWYAVRDAIGSVIDSMMNLGKNDPAATIKKLQADIASTSTKISNGDVSQTNTLRLDDDLNKLEVAQNQLTSAQEKATSASQKARAESTAMHAVDTITDYDNRHKKDSLDGYTAAVKAYQAALEGIRNVNPTSSLLDPAAIDQHMANLKKDYTSKGSTSKADGYQKASLQDVVKPIQDAIQAEAKTLADTQKLLDAQYAQGDISLQDYLNGEQDAREKAYIATVASYDKEIAATENYIASVQDATRKLTGETLLKAENAKKEQYIRDMTSKDSVGNVKDQKLLQDYSDGLSKLNIQLETLQGHLLDAATAQDEMSNRLARKKLTANAASGMVGAQDGLDNMNTIQQYTLANAAVSKQQLNYNLLLQQESTLEGTISLAQQKGTMTEIDGLIATRDSRKDQITQLQQIADNYTAIADKLGDPKMIADAQAFKLKIDQTAESADVLAIRMNTMVSGPLETFFSSALSGTTSVSQAFANMANSILGELDKIVAKQIVAGLIGSGTGGAGGLGAIISGFFSGSTGTGATTQSAGADVQVYSQAKGYADGGFVSGKGSGKSDDIFAMLSNGEFVMSSDATLKHRGLLEAINNGQSIAPRKFADGGLVGQVTLPNNPQSGTNIVVQIVNEGSQQQQVKSATPQFDINGMVVKIVLNDLQKGGPIRSSIQNLAKP